MIYISKLSSEIQYFVKKGRWYLFKHVQSSYLIKENKKRILITFYNHISRKIDLKIKVLGFKLTNFFVQHNRVSL